MQPNRHQLYSQLACWSGSRSDMAFAHSFPIDGTKQGDDDTFPNKYYRV